METAIETRGLSKNFKDVAAVSLLDLTVNKGEIFGLVGPDGAGKTTTLRMLSTALLPDSGSASVAGFDVVKQAEDVKLSIGYMSQRFSLYSDLTVEENIDFYSEIYQVPPDEARARKDELLLANNLTHFRDRIADQLSGGMKKKLALTCTLIHTPSLIILDEPTTGVDPLSRREFWRILYSLIPCVTIIMSTPYMDEAERCNRIGLMNKGRLVMTDTPKKILEKFNGEILEIKCDCIREGKKILSGLSFVREVQVFGDSLHVFLDSVSSSKDKIEELLRSRGAKLFSVKAIRPSLEDVFISILK
jgi:ABC-2 type transport system ATP-binding protein